MNLLAAVDEEGRFHQLNSTWNRTTGRDDAVLARMTLFDCMSDSDADNARRTLMDVIATGRSAAMETRLQHMDGSRRWIDWSVSRIAEEPLVYLVGRDVTERRLQEQRFHGLLESAPDALVVIDETGTIVFANGQADQLFGYERRELVGQPIEMLVPERFRSRHPADVRAFFERPQLRAMGAGRELCGRRKAKSEFPAEISLSPVVTDAGTLVCSAVRDVSDRRRAQRLTEAMLDSTPDAMVIADESGTIKYVNAEAVRLFGYPRELLIDLPLQTLLPLRFREGHPAFFAAFLADPQIRRMGSGRVLYGQHADGTEFPIDVSLSPIRTDDGLLIASAIRRAERPPMMGS